MNLIERSGQWEGERESGKRQLPKKMGVCFSCGSCFCCCCCGVCLTCIMCHRKNRTAPDFTVQYNKDEETVHIQDTETSQQQ